MMAKYSIHKSYKSAIFMVIPRVFGDNISYVF